MSLYVCGAHPEQSVSWKGTGCPVCKNEDIKREEKRQAKRDARAERLKYVAARS